MTSYLNRRLFGIHYWFYLSAIIAGVVVYAYPQIDIKVSQLFFNGHEFYLKDIWWVQWAHAYGTWPAKAVGITAGVLFIYLLLARQVAIQNISRKTCLYLILTMALGPVLIVNTLLKDQWGRARPESVIEFGGDKQFTPAFVMTDMCDRNCSFVSGHAAAGFYFTGLALLAASRYRKPYMTAAVLFGVLLGLGRIIQGKHFFSDVLFSGVFVYMVNRIVYYWMYERSARNNSIQ